MRKRQRPADAYGKQTESAHPVSRQPSLRSCAQDYASDASDRSPLNARAARLDTTFRRAA
jgi:hypothetical protein